MSAIQGRGALDTRVRMMASLGKIGLTRTDQGRGRYTMTVQVRFPETGEVRDHVPVMGLYGVSSRPKAGADAAVLFLAGNRGAGVCIATSDGRFSVNLAEGEVALHSDDGTYVHVQQGGKVAVKAATSVTIDTPLVDVTGDLKASGISLVHHRHPENGAGGGTTSEPIRS